ncbi:MAG: hypothetical protein ABR552_01150 [Actinomycetota bacterium]
MFSHVKAKVMAIVAIAAVLIALAVMAAPVLAFWPTPPPPF